MFLRTYYWSVVFIVIFVFCEGQLVDSNSSKTNTSTLVIPRYPNCCEFRNQTYDGTECNYSNQKQQTYKHIYYESNKTHINDHPVNFTLNFYYNPINCQTFETDTEEIVGFIFNGSFIERYEGKIYNPSEYCISDKNNNIVIFMCDSTNSTTGYSPISTGQVYFPCLIVSTLCYLCSAIIYKFVLDVKEVFQKCFIGYCVSMTVTFLFLILLQKINRGCEVLGSIFFLFILSSFVWLFCMCFDMVYSIRTVMRDNIHIGIERIYLYIAGSIVIPCIILFISMISAGYPDVPNSFMKGYGMCDFPDCRITVLFVPIGLLLLLALASLIYAFYLITLNNKKYTQNINWLEKKSVLKYKCYQCVVLICTMTIFFLLSLILSIMSNPEMYEYGLFFSVEIIDSLQGLLIWSVFVVHFFLKRLQNSKCKSFEEFPLNNTHDNSQVSSVENSINNIY